VSALETTKTISARPTTVNGLQLRGGPWWIVVNWR